MYDVWWRNASRKWKNTLHTSLSSSLNFFTQMIDRAHDIVTKRGKFNQNVTDETVNRSLSQTNLKEGQHLWLTSSLKCVLSFSGGISSSKVRRRRYAGFYCVSPCISHRLQYSTKFSDVMTPSNFFSRFGSSPMNCCPTKFKNLDQLSWSRLDCLWTQSHAAVILCVFSQQLFQTVRWQDQSWLLPWVAAGFVQLASSFLRSALEPSLWASRKSL